MITRLVIVFSFLPFYFLFAQNKFVNKADGQPMHATRYAEVGEPDITTSAKVQIKAELIAGWLVFAKGDMYIENDSLFFYPTKAKDLNGIDSFLYTKNHLFTPLGIPLSNVYEIARRNPLLLFPNRFIVKLKDGRKYKFFSYRRAKIRNAFYSYKNQQEISEVSR